MKRTIKSLKAEALEHSITIRNDEMYTKFITSSGDIVAWAVNHGSYWTGFTSQENVTGRKQDRKIVVFDWCLDWAINGF